LSYPDVHLSSGGAAKKFLTNKKFMTQPGDKRIETFYKKHARKLWIYAENQIKDRDMANIIVNDAFLQKQDVINTKDEITALKYLYITIKCDCIDYLRKQKSTKKQRMEYERWIAQPGFFDDPEIAQGELFQLMRDGMESELTAHQNKFTKDWMEHIGTAKELGRQLGVAETTVANTKKTVVDKIRAFIRRKFKK
jgi:DNA-directed RNA polymerase specialized sigma24 family protein